MSKIKKIEYINRNNEDVYNISVESNHNYYANNILVSNCHKLRKGNKINKIVSNIKTKHKFSFTGTMPENKIDEWNIIGQFGPILMRKTSKELQNDDFVSDALVQVLRIKYKKPLVYKYQSTFLDPTARYDEECEFIYNHPYRNKVIAKA